MRDDCVSLETESREIIKNSPRRLKIGKTLLKSTFFLIYDNFRLSQGDVVDILAWESRDIPFLFRGSIKKKDQIITS